MVIPMKNRLAFDEAQENIPEVFMLTAGYVKIVDGKVVITYKEANHGNVKTQ